MPMGLYDGVLLSIQICSIGQWGKILVMVMGFVGTFELGQLFCVTDLVLRGSFGLEIRVIIKISKKK